MPIRNCCCFPRSSRLRANLRLCALSFSAFTPEYFFDVTILARQFSVPAVFLRKCSDIFVETLCTVPNRGVLLRAFGKRVDLIRLDVNDAIHFAGHYNSPCRSLGKVEQGTDPFGGRGMAAKQTHWTIVACSKRMDRETGVVAFQFVEGCDQRLPVSGQFERGGIRVQFAGAR